MALEQAQQELIAEWLTAKEQLAHFTKLERDLRDRIGIECFEIGEGELREGTERVEIANGYSIKIVHKVNRSFPDKDKLRAVLDEIENMGPHERVLADRIVTWTPALAIGEFKKAPDVIQEKLRHVFISKPGAATLDFEPPKK